MHDSIFRTFDEKTSITPVLIGNFHQFQISLSLNSGIIDKKKKTYCQYSVGFFTDQCSHSVEEIEG